MKKVKTLHQKLLELMERDFEGCEWFIIAANELMGILHESIEMFKDSTTPFETIKDSIGKIGIGIGNVERCLDGVEDFYNKSVEIISSELKKKKTGATNPH